MRAPDSTPLYVHFPYCAAKCHYCDFYSLPAAGGDVAGVVESLLAEAELHAPKAPRTVFFGGGTPSLMSAPDLVRLFERLEHLTGFRSSAEEVTVEANPESLTLEKARLLRELGATRLSIGFQSLRPQVLELFGRVHSVEESFRAFEAARGANFEQVNIDLIYAAPGHTLGQWERDLERVIALAPEHISAYNLAFEEETRFSRWLAEGKIEKTPDELELVLFAATRSALAEAGYEGYEISNYARPGHACRHNLNYWQNGSYLGIGPSAASKVGLTRSGNVRSLSLWRERMQRLGLAREWQEELSWSARLAESWWLGLRLAEGISAQEARRRSACEALSDDQDPALSVASALARRGLLSRMEQRWRIPADSLAVADSIAARFLNDIPRDPRALAPLPS